MVPSFPRHWALHNPIPTGKLIFPPNKNGCSQTLWKKVYHFCYNILEG
jgi:hypothetical protein